MIYTWSKFNYGTNITSSNQKISFKEPTKENKELVASIASGGYTLGEFAEAIQSALNEAGLLTYTVTVDRNTNKISIAGSANFSMLISSGTSGYSAFETMGFYQVSDLTGQTSYTASNAAGKEYFPQFLLQSYVPPENYKEATEATINKSSDGRIEVVSFGVEEKIEMDIKFITDLPMDGLVIKSNPNGLSDARDFLSYISTKKRFEFVPDLKTPSVFYKVILDSAPGSNKGTGFKLKELFTNNLPDIYETGVITLLVVS